MNIFHDDLLKNKYFVSVLVVIGLIVGVAWFINYNSVEARCQRYAESIASVFDMGGNKLRQMQVQEASKTVINDCIKRGGPTKR